MRDYRFIKMVTNKTGTYIFHRDMRLNFGAGFEGIRRALYYIEVQRILAKAAGRSICSKEPRLYPVKSLIPKVSVKTLRYGTIDEEVV